MMYVGHRFGIYAYTGKQYFTQDDYGNLVKIRYNALIYFEHYRSDL